MLSLFSIPKPFHGHIGIIQTNAIRSWVSLRPACEVILLGNEEGTAEIASELGIRHIPEVDRNEYGTPLVSSVFDVAQKAGSCQLMSYVNADIILMSDFPTAIRQVKSQAFLLIGRRWDVDLKEPVDFSDPDCENRLRAHLAEAGKLRNQAALDYFVFPRGMYHNIPPFAIGRTAWDNWLVYRARSLRVPVIDATKAIAAIHQNHDYSHHLQGHAGVWKGPEAERNAEIMGGSDHFFTVDHATWILTPRGMKRGLSIRQLYFRLSSIPVLVPYLRFLNPFMKGLTKLVVFVLSLFRRWTHSAPSPLF